MLYSRNTIAALSLLPVIFSQSTTTTGSSTSADTAAGNSSNTTSDTAATPVTTPAATSAQSLPAPTVSGTSCGTTQQNFNQCVTKVAKDISGCPSTDNTCLCQTYANIAACYNACPDLTAQGASYQQQSTQYCSIAGIKPNTTATVATNVTTATPVKPVANTTNTTPTTRTNSTTAPVSVASTFAANSGAADLKLSVFGLFTAAVGVYAALFA